MLHTLFYRLAYGLGRPPWDTGITPPEVVQALASGTIPEGAALDLGCGTGTNVVYLARQGRQAIGIDFVPAAIAKARARARQAGVAEQVLFFVADVTHLEALPLPRVAFALDMGCFHGLSSEGRQRYAEGLAALMLPGGHYLLYAHEPALPAGRSHGVNAEQVQVLFTPWFNVERIERSGERDRASAWYWMYRKGSPS